MSFIFIVATSSLILRYETLNDKHTGSIDLWGSLRSPNNLMLAGQLYTLHN